MSPIDRYWVFEGEEYIFTNFIFTCTINHINGHGVLDVAEA